MPPTARSSLIRIALSGFIAAALSACASGSRPQAAPAPVPLAPAPVVVPAGPAALLQPPPEALRTGERLKPTGLELGTMWTFENPPMDYWAREYNFRPTTQWLDHVRLSSVRFADYCSASFVSADGLVMTNHHCGRECVESQSTPQRDYVTTGFYATTRQEEKLCPNLYLDQLVSIEDVTGQVQGATPAGAGDSATAAAVRAATGRIEQACAAATKLQCQVVPLYHGGLYHLYRYQRISPVKLVFAPELQAGFFGGDPDNFTYPRYDLDVTFVRAYQPDGVTPLHPANYFQWRTEGAAPGEPVFVTGNPGSTSRLITVAQLMYEREFRHPFLIAYLQSRYDALQQEAKQGPDAAQRVRQEMFEVSNSLKAYQGEERGLLDTLVVGRKIAWERDFKTRLAANAQAGAQYGDVFDRMAAIAAQKMVVAPRLNASNVMMFDDPLQLAGLLARVISEKGLPDAQRSEQLRNGQLEQLQGRLGQPVPFDAAGMTAALAQRLHLVSAVLPAGDPLLAQMVNPGETPEQAASRLVGATRIGDAGFRQQLLSGGSAALSAATDPLMVLARQMEANTRDLTPRWQQVQAEEQAQQARLARALFAVYGTSVPPDATFTLRISDGRIDGYAYNGTLAPAYTTIYGLYGRSAEFQDKDPFTLAPTWAQRRSAVDMSRYLNQVSTNDITGGNNGSPLIDEQGRIVGLVFDSNIEALPTTFMFPIENGRTVAVHTAGITEALRSVYQAAALVKELTGR